MLFRSNDTATTEIYTRLYTLSLHDALPFSATPAHYPLPPPELDEHGEELRKWLAGRSG